MKMMEGEKPHRSGGSSSELFICFTSRASSSSNSSSMKISSKSILSPGRTDKFRDGSSMLHTSLSRRLRSNGSMKGGQASPMFPAGTKKKGCAFDTPEPSSPKVTCIGQVRVKTKKQGKKMRSRSKRRGEVSFRKTEQTQEGGQQQQQQQQQECLPNRNQRWVHLPLSICEALRTFGAEFNCFLPCGGRSSCSSNAGAEREKGEKSEGTAPPPPATTSSCGAVFARWLMALQESEEVKRREMMVGLVGEEDEERREKTEAKTEEKDDIEEEDVSICIPPKNALLLMRCRSEPLRMSAFASRFWESPVRREEEDEEDEDIDEEEEEEEEDEVFEVEVSEDAGEGVNQVQETKEEDEGSLIEIDVEEEKEENREEVYEKSISSQEDEHPLLEEESPSQNHENPEKEEAVEEKEIPEKAKEEEQLVEHQSSEEDKTENHGEDEDEEVEMVVNICSSQVLEEQEFVQDNGQEAEVEHQEEEEEEEEEEKTQERRLSCSTASVAQEESGEEEKEKEETEAKEPEEDAEEVGLEEEAATKEEEKSTDEKDRRVENPIAAEAEAVAGEKPTRTEAAAVVAEKEVKEESERKRRRAVQLPECLLMMMCEPKLSMEVSKETWVCSTDFMRCRPSKPADHQQQQQLQQQQQRKPRNEGAVAGEERRRSSTDSNPANQAVSMATVVEQKLVNSAAYEPFVLTRCKSEPMRSSAKLAPEACFWKSRKLPHVGVGEAGIGF